MKRISKKEVNRSIIIGIIMAIILLLFAFIPLAFEDINLTFGYFISISLSYFLFFILLEIN